jgi:hypothetical protein
VNEQNTKENATLNAKSREVSQSIHKSNFYFFPKRNTEKVKKKKGNCLPTGE